MSDDLLFREVDEEVRRDELQNLWDKWGTYIIAGCLGIIIAVGGIKGWQFWQKQQAEKGGAAYFAAVDLAKKGKTEEAAKAFSELQSNHAGFGIFARFKQAAALADKGDAKAAVAAYEALAGDAGLEPALQHLAQVKAAFLLIDTAGLDEIKKRLSPFDTPTGEWRIPAREAIALSAYRAGDYQLADRKLNEILADAGATAGARQRATILLSILAPILDAGNAKSN